MSRIPGTLDTPVLPQSTGNLKERPKDVFYGSLPNRPRMKALQEKKRDILLGPLDTARWTNRVNTMLTAIGHAFMHIPGIGIFFSATTKVRIAGQAEEAKSQFQTANKTRISILGTLHRPGQYPNDFVGPRELDPLDIQRGVSVHEFWSNPEVEKRGVEFLLANTTEYAQRQIMKRYQKLQITNKVTDVQMMGSAIGIAVAPLGLGVSLGGLATKLAVKAKSGLTFLYKLATGTLGKERNEHASLLFGLALKGRKTDYVHPLIHSQGFDAACQRAHTLLKNLGIDPDATDFENEGFQKIRDFLRS